MTHRLSCSTQLLTDCAVDHHIPSPLDLTNNSDADTEYVVRRKDENPLGIRRNMMSHSSDQLMLGRKRCGVNRRPGERRRKSARSLPAAPCRRQEEIPAAFVGSLLEHLLLTIQVLFSLRFLVN
jgi:hypothetical protein